jgi:hypothetical protein
MGPFSLHSRRLLSALSGFPRTSDDLSLPTRSVLSGAIRAAWLFYSVLCVDAYTSSM